MEQPLRRQGLSEGDPAPECTVGQRHRTFHLIVAHGEPHDTPGEFAREGLLRRAIAAVHDTHGDGLAVHDFVELHRDPARLFGQIGDVAQRILVMTGALSNHTDRFASPIAENCGFSGRRLVRASRIAGRNPEDVQTCYA